MHVSGTTIHQASDSGAGIKRQGMGCGGGRGDTAAGQDAAGIRAPWSRKQRRSLRMRMLLGSKAAATC